MDMFTRRIRALREQAATLPHIRTWYSTYIQLPRRIKVASAFFMLMTLWILVKLLPSPLNVEEITSGINYQALPPSLYTSFNETLDAHLQYYEEVNKKYYDVNYTASHPFENECVYPILDPNEPDFENATQHYTYTNCTKVFDDFLVRQFSTGEILVGQPHFSDSSPRFRCYAQKLLGGLIPNLRKWIPVGEPVRLPPSKRIYVNFDNFLVTCYNGAHETSMQISYRFWPWIRHQGISSSGIDKHEVVTIISRHAPKTLKFMRENEFNIMHMYNKVADNTLFNMAPIFAGKTYDVDRQGNQNIIPKGMIFGDEKLDRDFWNDVLVRIMQKKGYVTMWNDDFMHIALGLFSYTKFHGFYDPPANYFFRPFYNYLYRKSWQINICVQSDFVTDRFLYPWQNFAIKYKDQPHFGFTFASALTHDNGDALELMDEKILEGFTRMKESGVMENTVLIMFGDHGQRVAPIQYTYSGRIEERQPLFSIYFPKRFREQHPDWMANFEKNKQRFFSNYDIHEMLRQILKVDEVGREKVGTSLFEELPLNRTCTELKVPEHHCTCMEKVDEIDIILNDTMKEKVNDVVKEYVNSALIARNCIRLYELNRVGVMEARTINLKARNGWRDGSNTDTMHRTVPQRARLTENEIFTILLEHQLIVKQGTIRSEFKLKSRVHYNQITGLLKIVAKPMLLNVSNTRGTHPYVLENICNSIA